MKQKLLSGLKYNALQKYANVVIALVFGAILARLLSPEEYGVVAVLTVFYTFFSMFSDFGISTGIVQFKELSIRQLQAINTITLFLAFILAIAFYWCSFLIAEFYNNPVYVEIGLFSSITLFFATIQVVYNGILRRDNRFKEIAYVSIVVNVFSGVFAIILAWKGFGFWSLVYRSVLSGFFNFILFNWITKLPFNINFDFRGIGKMLKYSSYNFLFNFVNYFSRNLDNILIGKYIGVAALGYYEKAYTLMRMPLDNITVVITPVLHPVLSSPEISPEKIFDVHKKLIEMMAFFGVPISIFLFFAAEPIVLFLYGEQWVETIKPFKWLALSVWIQMILSSTGVFFQINNQPKWLFITGLISSLILVAAIITGIYFSSIVTLAMFLSIAFFLNLFQSFYFISKFVFKTSYFYFIEIIENYLILGCFLFGILSFIQINLHLNLFLEAVLNFSLVCLFWFLFDKYLFRFKENFVKF